MGYYGTGYDYRAGADADNLSALERELGWVMKQSCHDGLYGTDEDRAQSRAIEDTLRSRIRAARKLASDPDFYSAVNAAENDWIAS
jgi:hypothetical protein